MRIRTTLPASMMAFRYILLLFGCFRTSWGFQINQGSSIIRNVNGRRSSSCRRPVAPLFSTQQSSSATAGASSSSTSSSSKATHGLAILTMPTTSIDRIANDAILETALRHALMQRSNTLLNPPKLSIVLRNKDRNDDHSLARLRRYVGEVYSSLWDAAVEETMQEDNQKLLDVVVYPQNLPNAAPERWITHSMSDLQWICSHDSICGWTCDTAAGRGTQYEHTEGVGGLEAHVQAVNVDRRERNLPPVQAVEVEHWPDAAVKSKHVVFLDDEVMLQEQAERANGLEDDDEKDSNTGLVGGALIPSKSLYNSVAVGGTFDGMHYGHRKLLTLAVSSVFPGTGKLLVGVTVDEMLQHKQHADLIPPYKERAEGVREFLHRLAPGIKNRIQVVPIRDAYGPPGSPEQRNGDFEALVLSHETLDTGHLLNRHRQETLGLPPLVLLCTRRTEPNGMSSTAMRRLQYMKDHQSKDKQV